MVPECLPRRHVLGGTLALRIVQPSEQVANRFRVEEGIKPGGSQRHFGAETDQRLVGQAEQGARQSLAGRGVGGDFDLEATIRAPQVRFDCPVASVFLGKERPPVLKFGQRLQGMGTLGDGPQVLSANTGEVKNWRLALMPIRLGQSPGNHAPKPDGGSSAGRWIVGSQRQQWDLRPKTRQQRFPLAVLVRPEHGDGRCLVALVVI